MSDRGDIIDQANDRVAEINADREAEIRRAAAAIPTGEPGDCDYCGLPNPRLVRGACAPFLEDADPTPAAQAHREGGAEPAAPAKPKGKKAKAKAAPAPASPANEPAAPVKTLGDWPFPMPNEFSREATA